MDYLWPNKSLNQQHLIHHAADPGMEGSPAHRRQYCQWRQEEMKGFLNVDAEEMLFQVYCLKAR